MKVYSNGVATPNSAEDCLHCIRDIAHDGMEGQSQEVQLLLEQIVNVAGDGLKFLQAGASLAITEYTDEEYVQEWDA